MRHASNLRPTLAPRVISADTRLPGAPVVEARDFRFAYGNNEVLKGISLGVERNAVTAIIGPSGCGKSTFLRAINRMHELLPGVRHSGDLLLDGTSVYAPGRDLVDLRRRIGMVFQRPNPFPKSIFDNVAYGPAINRLVLAPRPPRPGGALPSAGRPLGRSEGPAATSPAPGSPAASSSGSASRARWPTHPEVLLMDEPCSALDPIATQKVEELIFELKRHYTIVIVTHNMQQAARVSDFTGFFDRGELIEFGETEQLFTAPAHERTEAYITGRFG